MGEGLSSVEAMEEEGGGLTTPTWGEIMAEAMKKGVELSRETTPSTDEPAAEPMAEGEGQQQRSGETTPTTGETTPTTSEDTGSGEATPIPGEVVTESMVEEEKRLKEGGSRESSVESEQRGEASRASIIQTQYCRTSV